MAHEVCSVASNLLRQFRKLTLLETCVSLLAAGLLVCIIMSSSSIRPSTIAIMSDEEEEIMEMVDHIQLDWREQQELIKGSSKVSQCCQIKQWAVTLWPQNVDRLKGVVEGVFKQDWCILVLDTTESRKTRAMVMDQLKEIQSWNNPRFKDKFSTELFDEVTVFCHTRQGWVVHLTAENQRRLPFKIVRMARGVVQLPRKNIGYMYAMSEGAELILDLDVDAAEEGIDMEKLDSLPINIELGPHRRLSLDKEDLFNETATDGGQLSWYPHNSANPWNFTSLKDQRCKPIIHNYIVSTPDEQFDHSVRQVSATSSTIFSKWTNVVMPRNVLALYDSKATIYLKEAFWSMVIPPSVHPILSETLRALVAQSLFYLIPDACLMLWRLSNKAQHQPRLNTKASSAAFMKETQTISDVIHNLPLKENLFPFAFRRVYEVLQKHGMVSSFDMDYAQAWFEDLYNIGIQMPGMPRQNSFTNSTQLCLMFNHKHIAKVTARELAAKYLPLFNNVHLMIDSTPTSWFAMSPLTPPAYNVRMEEVSTALQTEFWPKGLTYEPCLSYTGYQQHKCLYKCLQRAKGQPILFMGDDVFLNFIKANQTLSRDKIWFLPIGHKLGSDPENEEYFKTYSGWNYNDQLVLASKALKSLPMHMKADYLTHVKETGQVEGHTIADTVYIPPQFHKKLMLILAAINRSAPVIFSEAAMPLAINLVAPGHEKKEDLIPSVMMWNEAKYRVDMHKKWIPRSVLLHPLKISIPALRSVWRDAMAEQYKGLRSLFGK